MCMRKSEEGCILAEQQEELKAKVEKMDGRLTTVETDVATIRKETQDGFRQGADAMRAIDASVANLAHDFGTRMNNLETRVISEKEKWGECLRRIVVWTARVMLTGCTVAMGVTAYKQFIT